MVTSDGYLPEGISKTESKEDLIVPVNFRIISAGYGLKLIRRGNDISSWVIGSIPENDFGVEVYGQENIPIKKILFKGHANLEEGDFIRAYIEKYNVNKVPSSSGPIVRERRLPRKFYSERDFNEKEIVHKIEKLNPNNLEEVLATFRS